MQGRGERLNLTSDPEAPATEAAPPSSDAAPASSHAARPYVAIHFACCGVYTKIYLNKGGTAYHGACPKCCRPATIRVTEDGTDDRHFVAH